MKFKPYKLKYQGLIHGTRSYYYGSTSVIFSKEKDEHGTPVLIASFSAHNGSSPLDVEEINGILSYLGMDTTKPIEHFTIGVNGGTRSNTQYYTQAA